MTGFDDRVLFGVIREKRARNILLPMPANLEKRELESKWPIPFAPHGHREQEASQDARVRSLLA